MNLNKPKGFQLISLHKSGSTWVHSYIHKKYRRFGVTLPPSNLYSEFFTTEDREDNDHDFVKQPILNRIKLLEDLRSFGLELAHKAHVPEIIDIWPWFKEFYKDHDVLVLKRRAIWSHWLNILFFYCIKAVVGTEVVKGNDNEGYTYITPSKVEDPRAEDILKSTIHEYKIEFKFHNHCWQNFIKNIRFLNDVVIEELDKPQVIFVEDITTEWLEERFRIKVKNTVTPFKTLNYESYFKPKELQVVKDIFNERFDNEFKYMGYELK